MRTTDDDTHKHQQSHIILRAMALTSFFFMTKPQAGWALYDSANSAFSALILTFIYSVYFSQGIVGDEIKGAALWSYAISASGLLIAISAPFLGAAADIYGRLKTMTLMFVGISIIATACLYLGTPNAELNQIIFILLVLIIANTALELSLIFYNALLPYISSDQDIGKVSGKAWGIGYLGGLCCLVLALCLFIGIGPLPPLLSLPTETAQNIRAIALLVALWFGLLTIPLWRWCPDTARNEHSYRKAFMRGSQQLWQTIKATKKNKSFLTYLIASMFYRDGLVTMFAIGGIYAAGVFDMDMQDILLFAIGLNLTAGIGAFAFSHLDDKLGSRSVIVASLIGLLVTGLFIIMVDQKIAFISTALCMGLFIGPVQSASRTYIARLVPKDHITQSYGLYALTGKSTAFLGPLIYGLTTTAFESQRAGMATILLFWAMGLILVLFVNDQRANKKELHPLR